MIRARSAHDGRAPRGFRAAERITVGGVNDPETFHVVVPDPEPHAYLVSVDHATNRWHSIPPIEPEELPFRYRNGLRGQYILRPNGSVVITHR